jgi:hypothetical protein
MARLRKQTGIEADSGPEIISSAFKHVFKQADTGDYF